MDGAGRGHPLVDRHNRHVHEIRPRARPLGIRIRHWRGRHGPDPCPLFAPLPTGVADIAQPLAWALAAGGLWWGLSVASLMWATVRLEPARVGLLLMSEVVVGAASAAFFAGERLATLEIVGGALVLCAAGLEIWPARRKGVQ